MKKQEYVSPEMEIVEIKTQGILATSDPFDNGNVGQEDKDTPGEKDNFD